MKYEIFYTDKARKFLKKLDKSTLMNIKHWIEKNLLNTENPRLHGKALVGDKSGYWRYRVGDYRIIAEIKDDKLIVLVVDIDHRSKIYNK